MLDADSLWCPGKQQRRQRCLLILPENYGSWLSLVCARTFCATSDARSSDRFIQLCSETSRGGGVGWEAEAAAGLAATGAAGRVALCFCQK